LSCADVREIGKQTGNQSIIILGEMNKH